MGKTRAEWLVVGGWGEGDYIIPYLIQSYLAALCFVHSNLRPPAESLQFPCAGCCSLSSLRLAPSRSPSPSPSPLAHSHSPRPTTFGVSPFGQAALSPPLPPSLFFFSVVVCVLLLLYSTSRTCLNQSINQHHPPQPSTPQSPPTRLVVGGCASLSFCLACSPDQHLVCLVLLVPLPPPPAPTALRFRPRPGTGRNTLCTALHCLLDCIKYPGTQVPKYCTYQTPLLQCCYLPLLTAARLLRPACFPFSLLLPVDERMRFGRRRRLFSTHRLVPLLCAVADLALLP